MADITRRPFVSHFRGSPTNHVVHVKRGKTSHEGTGLAFWFRPLTAVLAEVPVDDRELPMLFHARTKDFQDVAVQASMTYRFVEPATAIRRLDFAVDPGTGKWNGTPLEQVAMLLTELAQQQALTLIATLELADALASGPAAVQARITQGLAEDARLTETGIGVVGVRVVAVKPESDVERALRTPTREQIQQEADRAGYERRALAVERERAISENELQSRIELARREEQLVAQEGANARRRATEKAAAEPISMEMETRRIRDIATAEAERSRTISSAEAERSTVLGEAEAARSRMLGAAEAERNRVLGLADADKVRAVGASQAEAEAALMAVYASMDPRILMALGIRRLAESLPEIGTLNLSPDIVSSALARLAGGANGSNGSNGDGPSAGDR